MPSKATSFINNDLRGFVGPVLWPKISKLEQKKRDLLASINKCCQ